MPIMQQKKEASIPSNSRKNMKDLLALGFRKIGRGDWIRTSDPLLPRPDKRLLVKLLEVKPKKLIMDSGTPFTVVKNVNLVRNDYATLA